MLNLILTNKCNLDCSYCFAKNIINETMEEFSIENILKILDFIEIDGTNQIGLLGGEPFLHSKIDKILKLLINRDSVKDVIIYTNGLFDKSILKYISNEKFKLLVNCNSPLHIKNHYNNLLENLIALNEIKNTKISIGINLPYIEFDYNYIFDLMKILNKKILRFSFATKTEEKRNIVNPIKYFKKIKPYIVSFYRDCIDRNIIPFPSCNTIPPCIYDTEDKKLLLKLFRKCLNDGMPAIPNIFFERCKPVVDVCPNFEIRRCFGLDDKTHKYLFDFSSVSEISKYYLDNIDTDNKIYINSNKKCLKCNYNKEKHCKLCLVYRK